MKRGREREREREGEGGRKGEGGRERGREGKREGEREREGKRAYKMGNNYHNKWWIEILEKIPKIKPTIFIWLQNNPPITISKNKFHLPLPIVQSHDIYMYM